MRKEGYYGSLCACEMGATSELQAAERKPTGDGPRELSSLLAFGMKARHMMKRS